MWQVCKQPSYNRENIQVMETQYSSKKMIIANIKQGVVGNEIVAVKRIRSSMTINQKLFRREVDSQMDINHENVVRFLGLCSHTVETPMKNPESPGYIYAEIRERLLCFEYVSNGSLDKYITGMTNSYRCSSSLYFFVMSVFFSHLLSWPSNKINIHI
jgi:serine/threonine protein kinase